MWCGLCGTYVYEGDTLPCSNRIGCAALGRRDIETVIARVKGASSPEELFDIVREQQQAQQEDAFQVPEEAIEVPSHYFVDPVVRDQRLQRLLEDAKARQAGVNLDGSPRRETVPVETPWSSQVGGSHYTKMKIQPFEYSLANGLGPCEHTVVKYVSRWKDKGGIQDLNKARHAIDILIAWARENGFN